MDLGETWICSLFQPLGDSGLRHTFPCSGLWASHPPTPCLPDPPPGGGACEFKANPREGRRGSNTGACRRGGHLLRSYYTGASSAPQVSEQTNCRPHSLTRFCQCRSKGSSFETTSGHRERAQGWAGRRAREAGGPLGQITFNKCHPGLPQPQICLQNIPNTWKDHTLVLRHRMLGSKALPSSK